MCCAAKGNRKTCPKYQDGMKENVIQYNEKLSILESIWYRLEEKAKVARKL